ncbi:MAG: hypothetical protein IKY43_07140 [Bacteroidales bacterium]|nr:hypothetical protein [Bacteroidales bacterium]
MKRIINKIFGSKKVGAETENVSPQNNEETVDNIEVGGSKIKFKDFITGKFLIRKDILSLSPLFIMAVLFSIIMVANRYYIENISYEINKLQKEVDKLHIQHIQLKCDYMNATMITEVTNRLKKMGIKESTDRPIKIKIDKE